MSVTSEASPAPPHAPTQQAPGWLKNLAIVTGLLGFLLFVATPFLPVNQVQSSLDWPQKGNVNSVNAPLISYAPQKMEAQIPVSAIADLREGESLLLGTLPADSTDAAHRGLFVRSYDGALNVSVRGEAFFDLSAEEVRGLPDQAMLSLASTEEETKAWVEGTGYSSTPDATSKDDVRPQVTGLYTELEGNAAAKLIDAGLNVHVEINSRFTSSATALKQGAIVLGLIMLVASLWCLRRLDSLDSQGHLSSPLPAGWWKPRPLDGLVVSSLALWHVIGANTADDGYILSMARLAEDSGYMANYYRWFGVPEAPFGWPYYDILGLMTQVSTASVWMRLPALLSGLIIWFTLSRYLLPRLGDKVGGRRLAQWTAALIFLAFWLPYNNGTRPEPIIAMGSILAWASFERAIETRRIFPGAVGVLLAALSLATGPTGLMAVAALLAALSPLLRLVYERLPLLGGGERASISANLVAALAMLAPVLATGTAVLVGMFGDQTLASVLEATRVRSEIGPALPWHEEFARYQSLFSTSSVDGSFTRRFPMFMFFASLAIVAIALLRNKKIAGAASGPTTRLIIIVIGTFFFLMFTPTKWTHHFGANAGTAAALAAVAAVALSAMVVRSARARAMTIGGFLLLFALALAGWNGWWYVSSFHVPWWDKPVQLRGIEASSVVLYLALAILVIGVVLSFIGDMRRTRAEALGTLDTVLAQRRRANASSRWAGLAAAPIAVLSAVVLAFSLLSFGKAFASQYPAYTVGLGNLRNFGGNSCGLASDALVETNTNASFLTPTDGISLSESLEAGENRGFGPNNLPGSVEDDASSTSGPGATIADQVDSDNVDGSSDSGQDNGNSGGSRGSSQEGVNGSTHELPFDLDYTVVPVLGSYQEDEQLPAKVTTAWYELPDAPDADAPLVVVSAFGKINHHDINGVEQEGQKLVLEYGTRQADGSVSDTGSVEMYDAGPTPNWRNLRYPLADLPEAANVVRIKAEDINLNEDEWLGITPPRVPTLDSLNNVIGSEQPGLLDWTVPLQFPCQRTFNHYVGVTEIPRYRISPDYPGKSTLTPVQNYTGGGPMGTVEAVNDSYELPSYLRDDWGRDWGSIEIYEPRTNSAGQSPDTAEITVEEITRSGLWNPGEMNIDTKN
ncbi:arabinosyltransferase domain-containing protein [Corynebacterium lowii]|uniref:Putative arabinosyltransferase C n=1 Tax=Corynebacterium lowii TaxID=1544413 RepID=A0A0N8W0M9_9CORY|nr:arabinosyltransferase domain-containing protein [Corynebacterium lowii]KQB87146.1 putative arabinosyltransferase C [Corynebacterium lowii]MDP9852268.1 arabinosyltransferase C [Corynebacterium lowii]